MGRPMSNAQKKAFVREERYVVFKKKDIATFLGFTEQNELQRMYDRINAERKAHGRGELSCVVVEDDWPETPVIWSMIEARMTGGVDFVQWQAARIIDLERQVAELTKGAGDAAKSL